VFVWRLSFDPGVGVGLPEKEENARSRAEVCTVERVHMSVVYGV
jgi:hypothetical protein